MKSELGREIYCKLLYAVKITNKPTATITAQTGNGRPFRKDKRQKTGSQSLSTLPHLLLLFQVHQQLAGPSFSLDTQASSTEPYLEVLDQGGGARCDLQWQIDEGWKGVWEEKRADLVFLMFCFVFQPF